MLNKRAKRRLTQRSLGVNKAGGLVYNEKPEQDLFIRSSALKLKGDAYRSPGEELKSYMKLLKNVTDEHYKLGLAVYLSEYLGIKLSPTILIADVVYRLRKVKGLSKLKILVKSASIKVFDRPDKIANALGYIKLKQGTIKKAPPYFKRTLSNILAGFSQYTLRKFRMSRRDIKLADLIKILRPKPKDKSTAKFYKNVIENNKKASIKKGTVITEVLSDKSRTEKQKKTWIKQNVSKLPYVALLRNLNNVSRHDAPVVERRFSKALRQGTKVVNPFDVITVARNTRHLSMKNALNNSLDVFSQNLDLRLEKVNVTLLVDVSGSMGFRGRVGMDGALKYMSLMANSLSRAKSLKILRFNTTVREVKFNKSRLKDSISDVWNYLDKLFPINGGTALRTAILSAYSRMSGKNNLLIVFTDEYTWADNWRRFVLPTEVKCPVLLINPTPSGKTVFDPTNSKVIKVSALDPRVFDYIPFLADFKEFKRYVKSLV